VLFRSPGNHTEEVADWGAYAGYRLIVLGWPNDGVTQEVCRHATDRTCYDALRRERLYGEDASDLAEVAPNDSIVGRLVTLLRYLDAEHPDEGWGGYLDGAEVRWDRVIGAGWSEGGTMIAYLGKEHALAGELLLAPGLDLYSNPDFTKEPDAWWSRPGVTPAERIYAMHSIYDPQAWPIDQFTPVLASLGITDAPVSIDAVSPPYRDSHHLVTGSIEWDKGEQCTTHGMIAVDGCIDEDVLMPAYFYVYCTLPGLAAPSP
jgi:hypothetical protein